MSQQPPNEYPYSNPNQQPYQPQGFPPMQQPQYQPPKKRRTGLWIALAIIAVLLFACIGVGAIALRGASSAVNSVSTTVATFTPATGSTPTTQAQTGTWTTTHTFTGSGIKKTGFFTVPNDWRLKWSCNPSSFSGGSYNLIVTVYNADGSIADVAVNVLCKTGTTSDTTEEHTGGKIYLDINSEADWTLKVQELK